MKRSLLFALALGACTNRPSRERFPGPQGRTTDVQQAQTEKAVLGGFDPLNNPISGNGPRAGGGSGGSSGDVKPSESVKGVVKLAPNVKLKANMFLFLSVRPAEGGEGGGPPLAVRREIGPDFPYEFVLSPADSPMGPAAVAARFKGQVVIQAKLKQDPDPLTNQEGDWWGSVIAKVGDQKIELLVDKPAVGEK